MPNIRINVEIGKKYSLLTVLKENGKSKQGHIKYLCKCDCGNTKTITGSNITRGFPISCGCLRKKNAIVLGKSRRNQTYLAHGQAGLNKIKGQYKNGAIKRGFEFKLEDVEFNELVVSNCYYCGVEPLQRSYVSDVGVFVYNGIDRLDNSKGYYIGNCVAACGRCNRAKDVFSPDEFYSWIERIYFNKRESF